eukprot:scaffold1127_cov133-Skeletonema_marinoi.AAC.5
MCAQHSEINPRASPLLPEVLGSNVCNNNKGRVSQAQGHNFCMEHNGTKVEAIEAETAAIEAAEGHVLDIWSEPRSNKRR